jgi:hypothetical protein
MTDEGIGNRLNRLVCGAQGRLFEQGELFQLTYGAFDIAARAMQESGEEEITVTYPIGYRADGQPMNTKTTYQQEELLRKYQFLAFEQLAINGLLQLVTIVEAMLTDAVRAVILQYPQKLGSKRTMPMSLVLEAKSLQEVYLRATDLLLNEMTYKSPAEFAEAVEPILSLKLLECPAFHKYMEVKASRDIFVHNRGIANEIYTRKAGSHVRVIAGWKLPASVEYFLQSYEVCHQLAEWIEAEFHEKWHSSEYEIRKAERTLQLELPAGTSGDSIVGHPSTNADDTDSASEVGKEIGPGEQ